MLIEYLVSKINFLVGIFIALSEGAGQIALFYLIPRPLAIS